MTCKSFIWVWFVNWFFLFRLKYPLSLLKSMFPGEHMPPHKVNVMYDIACMFSKSFEVSHRIAWNCNRSVLTLDYRNRNISKTKD